MKKIFTKTIAAFILSSGLLISLPAFADDPPPPPTHGEVGDIPGGGAPIGEGLLILAVLGAAYGGYKWYKYHKAKVAMKE
jgi:uncharacterized protein HemX